MGRRKLRERLKRYVGSAWVSGRGASRTIGNTTHFSRDQVSSNARTVLPLLRDASLPSSAVVERLRGLATEIDAAGPSSVAAALDLEITRRAKSYLAGLEAYRRHPYRRKDQVLPVLWREGTTRLLDYGGGSAGPVLLVVPSLINRFYVLDFLPERSFLRHLAGRGLRPLVVDWGAPGKEECKFDLTDYVAGRLEGAFDAALRVAGAPIGVAGYCMGGLFALALALRRPDETACLAVLATPWDFHAERAPPARFFGLIADCLPLLCVDQGALPVEVVQSLFFMLDPVSAERKFTRFAALDPNGDKARAFVALEDWVNDGVPLAAAGGARLRALLVRRQRAGSQSMANRRRDGRSEAAALARSRRSPEPRSDRPAEFGGAACGSARRRYRIAATARACRHDVGGARSGDAVDRDRRLAAGADERAVIRFSAIPAGSAAAGFRGCARSPG